MLKPLLIVLTLATPLAAETRAPDRERLAGFDATFGSAIRQALAAGATKDIAVLTDALRGTPGPLAPDGDWNCRTLKLGGIVALAVYGDFRCRIETAGPGEWRIDKLTGSQRMMGTITEVEGDAHFLGVGHVGTEPATGYAGLPPEDQTPVEPNQTHASVGRFEQMDGNRARLMLPAPILESDFDILYMTR